MRILAWRPIVCEHARGPAFLLSNQDKQGLAELLDAATRDPQLQVLEPVGWFVSHTRPGLRMTEDDLQVFDAYFTQPWQVTLVYHPARTGPTRAGFFIRERDGRIQAGQSHQEFTVDGVRTAEPFLTAPSVAAGAATNAATNAPAIDRRKNVQSRSGSHFRWAWAAVALLVCTIALFAVPKLRTPVMPAEPLQLRLLDAQGQLRIEWHRNNPTLQFAEAATLFIKDGDQLPPIELDRESTQRGSVTYARLSEDVTVRLVVKLKNQAALQELARYVGSPVPKIETRELRQVRQGRERLLSEARRLREELQKESYRTRDLERTVQRLESAIQRESRTR
ncbi:MAG TPA: hypothetical protein VM120_23745 [Bryobacteraceae bacterium]|nr:hypothetical protein [Bryobacteraceae bacterium]